MTEQDAAPPGPNRELTEAERAEAVQRERPDASPETVAPLAVREVADARSFIPGGYVVVDALGSAGEGGANLAYHAQVIFDDPSVAVPVGAATLLFPGCNNIDEMRRCGVVTNEALLAIVADRLRGFQSGPFRCPENAAALTHVECALAKLLDRTRARRARGVEGQSVA